MRPRITLILRKHTFAARIGACVLTLLAALWPTWAWAGCGPLDVGACVDGPVYSFWEGIAENLWGLNRAGLQLVYGVNQFRWWVVEVAFGFVYDILQNALGPLLVPIAVAAILVAVLAFVLSPLVGRLNIVDMRHALMWAAVAPTLLAYIGPHFADIEQARSDFASEIVSGGAEKISSIPVFGAKASDMAAPKELYGGGSPCGVALTRRTKGLMADDLAAAVADANVQDIFCPNAVGPGSMLPDAFYDQAGPVYYAYSGDVGNDLSANDRQAAIGRIKQGVVQLGLMLVPVALAVVDALVQLVFALCLVAVWLSLPIGLLVVYFQQTSQAVTGIFKQTLSIFQVSWTASALLGIVLVCLRAAAKLTNATAYAGFAFFGLILTAYVLIIALQTLKSSLATVNATVAMATGMQLSAGVDVVAGGAALAAGVVTGGAALATTAALGAAGMAATGKMAYDETGSGRYAVGAALGRIEPLAQLSQYAEATGMVDMDDDLSLGMYAGYRSAQTMRMGRTLMQRDAKTVDDATGLTVGGRAEERALLAHALPTELPVGIPYRRTDAGGVEPVTSTPTANAVTLPAEDAYVPRLVALGYDVRRNRDQTITTWQADDPAADVAAARKERTPDPAVAQALAQLDLIQRGAIAGDTLQAQEAVRAAQARAQAHNSSAGRSAGSTGSTGSTGNGSTTGTTGGSTNGNANSSTNGNANSSTNGNANSSTNGNANGSTNTANGSTNGTYTRTSNGSTNGSATRTPPPPTTGTTTPLPGQSPPPPAPSAASLAPDAALIAALTTLTAELAALRQAQVAPSAPAGSTSAASAPAASAPAASTPAVPTATGTGAVSVSVAPANPPASVSVVPATTPVAVPATPTTDHIVEGESR